MCINHTSLTIYFTTFEWTFQKQDWKICPYTGPQFSLYGLEIKLNLSTQCWSHSLVQHHESKMKTALSISATLQPGSPGLAVTQFPQATRRNANHTTCSPFFQGISAQSTNSKQVADWCIKSAHTWSYWITLRRYCGKVKIFTIDPYLWEWLQHSFLSCPQCLPLVFSVTRNWFWLIPLEITT